MEKYEYKLLKYVCSKFLCLRLILIFYQRNIPKYCLKYDSLKTGLVEKIEK